MNVHLYLVIAGNSVSIPLLVGLGFGVGLLSGPFGVGGGFLMTPLLIMTGVPPTVPPRPIPARSSQLPLPAPLPTPAWGTWT
jgi:hypothetical protein